MTKHTEHIQISVYDWAILEFVNDSIKNKYYFENDSLLKNVVFREKHRCQQYIDESKSRVSIVAHMLFTICIYTYLKLTQFVLSIELTT